MTPKVVVIPRIKKKNFWQQLILFIFKIYESIKTLDVMKLLTNDDLTKWYIVIRHENRFKLSHETVKIRQLFQKYASLTLLP